MVMFQRMLLPGKAVRVAELPASGLYAPQRFLSMHVHHLGWQSELDECCSALLCSAELSCIKRGSNRAGWRPRASFERLPGVGLPTCGPVGWLPTRMRGLPALPAWMIPPLKCAGLLRRRWGRLLWQAPQTQVRPGRRLLSGSRNNTCKSEGLCFP